MMHSPCFDGSSSLCFQMLMNADSLYTAAHCALLLNLKLSHGDYYRKRPTLAPGMMVSVPSHCGCSKGTLQPPGCTAERQCLERISTAGSGPHGSAVVVPVGTDWQFAQCCELQSCPGKNSESC